MKTILVPIIFVYGILLLVLGFTSSMATQFILLSLFILGLIISLSKIYAATKSTGSKGLKIYTSVVVSLATFLSIIFFWFIGKNPLLDEFGFGTVFTGILAIAGIVTSIIAGIILTLKRVSVSGYQYDLKKYSIFVTAIVVFILVCLSYNASVNFISQTSRNENLCGLSIGISNKSAMFNTSFKNSCIIGVVKVKPDISICKKISGSQTGCFITVATESNNPEICKIGSEQGLEGMDSCLSILIQSKRAITKLDLVTAINVCQKSNECGAIADMEDIVFNTLKDPNDQYLIYAIKAPKYMWKDGQRDDALVLLRNLLTSASLDNRKASMESILYITSIMDFESGKTELRRVLPLIENQVGLSDYTAQVKSRLSAQLLVPNGTTVPTKPR